MKEDEEKEIKFLEVKYLMVLMEGGNGNETKEVKKQLNEIYNRRSKEMIDKMRRLEIDDHMYDIKKLQRERKYEGQSKIKEIRINGVTHEGTVNVIKAVEEEMKKELKSKDAEEEKELFLKYIPGHLRK